MVGCGSSKQQTSNTPSTQSSGTSQESSGGDTSNELKEPKPVLKYLTLNAVLAIDQKEFTDYIKKHTGYSVEHIMLPAENAIDKLMLDLAGGVEYDMITTDYDVFLTARTSGALLELNDLIKQYGPNVTAAISQQTWDMLDKDGHYYGIPILAPMSTIDRCVAMRGDILTKLGKGVPTNVDEFYEVLKAVKDNTDLIPLVFTPAEVIEVIGSGFGLSTDFKLVDGKIVARIMQPEFLDYLVFMNKLYNEGLIDSEMPVTKSETHQEKFVSGRAFAINYDWARAGTYKPALLANVPDAQIALLHPLKNAEGKNVAVATGRPIAEMFYIPKSSKNAAYAMGYANSYLEPDTYRAMTIGEENVHYEVKNGDYYPILPKFTELNNMNLVRAGCIEEVYPKYWQARVRKNVDQMETFFELQEDANIAEVSPLYAINRPIWAKNKAALNTLVVDSVTAIIAGKPVDVKSGYEKMIANWLNAGGQDVINEANELYAAN